MDAVDRPDRRTTILSAALEEIIEVGLHQTTHRSIAARAKVPLGSLTYHFSGLQEIFEETFRVMFTALAADYRTAMAGARTKDEAIEVVVDLVGGGDYMNDREMRALFEMYSYGSTNAVVRGYCSQWMAMSRESLELHFSADAARALDVLVEGWPMHRYFEARPADRQLVRTVVVAVIDAVP